MKKLILYLLAAFGAYTVAVLASTRWWIRHAELNELLGQISDTPAPPVRPELVDATDRHFRQSQAAAGHRHREQLKHDWRYGR